MGAAPRAEPPPAVLPQNRCEACDGDSVSELKQTQPRNAAKPRRDKRLSEASAKATTELDRIAEQLHGMQIKSDDAELLLCDDRAELPLTLRNELCQLHGNANKLIATRLDAILTGDLHSGRDDARAMRKQLIFQAEALIERVEKQVKQLDQRREH